MAKRCESCGEQIGKNDDGSPCVVCAKTCCDKCRDDDQTCFACVKSGKHDAVDIPTIAGAHREQS